MNETSKTPWWVREAETIYVCLIACGFVLSFLIVGLQCLHWLQEGYWYKAPLITLFSDADFVANYDSWYNSPDSWLGVNKIITWILEKIPLSVAVIAFAFFLKFCWQASVEEYIQKNSIKEEDI